MSLLMLYLSWKKQNYLLAVYKHADKQIDLLNLALIKEPFQLLEASD